MAIDENPENADHIRLREKTPERLLRHMLRAVGNGEPETVVARDRS